MNTKTTNKPIKSNWPFPCQIVDLGEDPKDHPMHTCPKCLKKIDLGDGKGLRRVK